MFHLKLFIGKPPKFIYSTIILYMNFMSMNLVYKRNRD